MCAMMVRLPRTAPIRLAATALLAAAGLAIMSPGSSSAVADRLGPARGASARGGSDFIYPTGSRTTARAETTWFGSYTIVGGEYHAVPSPDKQSVMWTFDRGIGPYGDPTRIEGGEGWRSIDLSHNQATWFRVADAALDLGAGVPPPIITGLASLWIGADKRQADSLCWDGGAGYGNHWCQKITTPPLTYDGTGGVSLSFKYFNRSEDCYDGTQVYLERGDGSRLLLNPFAGTCFNNPAWDGGFTGTIGSYDAPALYNRAIAPEEIGGAQSIRITFEFTSDAGWSDEDGRYRTTWGPFGADDVAIQGGGIDVTQDFENGLAPWTVSVCPGIGTFAGIAPFGCYDYFDPCGCRLTGNVMEMHDGSCSAGWHPHKQHEQLESPICDVGTGDPHNIFLDLDLFAQLPLADGVWVKVRWSYYPWSCQNQGIIQWSPPVAELDTPYPVDPRCYQLRFSATEGGSGSLVPQTAQKVKGLIELVRDCDAFTIDPCMDSNPSPLFDNLVVGATPTGVGPVVQFETGAAFQDVGSTSAFFDPRGAGPANVTLDTHMDDPSGLRRCGDSLVVVGPVPLPNDPNTQWEAKLWWRVARRAIFNADREGGVPSRYKIWRDRVADGRDIDRTYKPEFTFGWMDSVQMGVYLMRYKFQSTFREDDDDFVGESNPDNEMLPDDVFYPGTRIEYFVTANYAVTPNLLSFLPDTTGGNFLEFEVLPGLRTAKVPGCGGSGHDVCAYLPATLYVDAYNEGAQPYIERALAEILNGEPPCEDLQFCAVPADRLWDRYDYADAYSVWAAPFARGSVPGSNNGMTLQQILGYRTILVNTGDLPPGSTDDSDYALLQDWLTTPQCDANVNRQALFMNGDDIGGIMTQFPAHGRPLLENMLGAVLYCDAFNGSTEGGDCGSPNRSYCVRYLPSEIVAYGPDVPVDLYGNGCPELYRFDVFNTTGSGAGNRTYLSEDGLKEMSFGQIANQNLGADANYRSVVDGVSWHHMTERNASGVGRDRCPRDFRSIVAGITAELAPGLRWAYGVPTIEEIPRLTNVKSLAECQGTWNLPAGAGDETDLRVNRLWQNDPNPFNPHTTIRYSTARAGAVKVLVFDVGGRVVRTLVDGRREAGLHTVVWDGVNDRGGRVGSGVYWVQMRTGEFVSNKKMVVLK